MSACGRASAHEGATALVPGRDHRLLALANGRDDRGAQQAAERSRHRGLIARLDVEPPGKRVAAPHGGQAQTLADALQLDRDRALGARRGVAGLLGSAPAITHGGRLGREPLELALGLPCAALQLGPAALGLGAL